MIASFTLSSLFWKKYVWKWYPVITDVSISAFSSEFITNTTTAKTVDTKKFMLA